MSFIAYLLRVLWGCIAAGCILLVIMKNLHR